MIDAYASRRHYFDHLAPVLAALPDEHRGTVWTPSGSCPWGRSLNTRPRREPWGPVVVASYADARRMAGRRLILADHGAGQTYEGVDNGSYSGGAGLHDVALFICPSERVAERWRVAYPKARAVTVGSPKMDRLHRCKMEAVADCIASEGTGSGGRAWHRLGPEGQEKVGRPVVGITFHWPCQLVPEAMWALPHYRAALPVLRDAVRSWGGEVIGHGHPRAWRELSRLWASLGVEAVPDSDEVLRRADLLVADNTSLAFEAASIGMPVLMLNAPWFRRDIDHGLRFWSHVPGLQVDEPEDLLAGVELALADPSDLREIRERAVAHAYSACDGRAAERAVAAIRSYVNS